MKPESFIVIICICCKIVCDVLHSRVRLLTCNRDVLLCSRGDQDPPEGHSEGLG